MEHMLQENFYLTIKYLLRFMSINFFGHRCEMSIIFQENQVIRKCLT